ncbi:LOW QUALITY PROTEIN: protein GLUTAMINE DUMPER 5-like [Cucumis melo]|uniref:LOW QUALITY PROTEIN: protein GLUTAMINE DUMPER 5-like n=1 Tax=Cucumis melo TaxID=3656 RepID=A0A1S3BCB1_CUCME|nr:LOW QUALITY PROTEIN: protein GLUTAMINE DUMPER 5-like [Cucumis melo]
MRNIISASSPVYSPEPPAVSPRTPWHSPVPYLFGGLAAMLGLIAFALLILACSYWKLSIQTEEREGENGDLESGNNIGEMEEEKIKQQQTKKIFEEKILVIMAGDQNPTFLATPVTTPKSSSISQNSKNVCSGKFDNFVEKNEVGCNCEEK